MSDKKHIRFSLARLGLRNVRRQMRNYIIYFVTVAVTVALMFAIDNVLYSPIMSARLHDQGTLQVGLGLVTAVIALTVSFVVGYAGSYMLRCRKREFGTYMTLGLDRGDILKLFWYETAVIGLLSLGVGIVLGLGVYQMLMLFVYRLIEYDAGFSGYSWRAAILTVGLVLGMFLVSSTGSALYLKRVKIYDLLHADRFKKGTTAHPVLWGLLALVMLAAVIACAVLFRASVLRSMQGIESAQYEILGMLFALTVAVFVLTVAAAKSITALLLKVKRFTRRNTATFVLRQLTSKMSANAVLFGLLAMLMTCSVVASNFAFALKASEDAAIAAHYPFSAAACLERGSTEMTPDRAEEVFAQYTRVTGRIDVPVYDTGKQTLLRHSTYERYLSEENDVETDILIRLSDYNRLLAALGRQTVETDGYLILDMLNETGANHARFADFAYTLGDTTLPCGGVVDETVGMGILSAFFIAVVPDAAVDSIVPTSDFYAWSFDSDVFDGTAMGSRLAVEQQYPGGVTFLKEPIHIRREVRERSLANSAVWIVAALYISIVFVFLSMAVLALKSLSDVDQNRNRYAVLGRVGLSKAGQSATLFSEICIFFLLPFLLPLLIDIPVIAYCGWILRLNGYSAATVYITGGTLVAVLVLVAFLYMIAAFALARKSTLS